MGEGIIVMLEMNGFPMVSTEIAATSLNQKVTSSDGIEFRVVTDDVIELTEEQFNVLTVAVLRKKAEYVRRDGIDIASLSTGQITSVLGEIQRIIGCSENPFEDRLIRISSHIINDHAVNPSELQRRGWYRDTIEEVYADIGNVIKESNHVRKAKLNIKKHADETKPKFTFTILGVKIDGNQGELSIAFIEDSSDLILAVTII